MSRPSQAALYSDPIDPNVVQTYSVEQTAKLLGVGEQTIRDHIRRHGFIQAGEVELKPIKVMSCIRFAKNAVHAALSA